MRGASTTIGDLGSCAKPLVVKHVVQPPLAPGDVCEQYVRVLERIARCASFPPASARDLRAQIPRLREMYEPLGC